jgi:hypothetical protein
VGGHCYPSGKENSGTRNGFLADSGVVKFPLVELLRSSISGSRLPGSNVPKSLAGSVRSKFPVRPNDRGNERLRRTFKMMTTKDKGTPLSRVAQTNGTVNGLHRM